MSLLAGSLFGVLRGVALVVFAATAGASSCYFLSNLIGRPLILSMWPDKLVFFQDQVRLNCLIILGFKIKTGNFYYWSKRETFITGQNGLGRADPKILLFYIFFFFLYKFKVNVLNMNKKLECSNKHLFYVKQFRRFYGFKYILDDFSSV